MPRIDSLILAGLGVVSSVFANTLPQRGPPLGAPNVGPPRNPPRQDGGLLGLLDSLIDAILPNPGAGRSAGSPEYTWLFEYPLPIPEVAQPLFTETVNGIPIEYYETTIEPFQQQVYPNLSPANLIGYG